MPGLFSSKRDIKLFNHFGKELINNITGLFVMYYELIPQEPNVYGEIKDKRFYPGVKMHGIVQKEELETDTSKGYLDLGNKIVLYFQHIELKRTEIFPKPGDLVAFGLFVYEIGEIVNPALYPLTDDYFSYFKVSASLTQIDPSGIQIIRRRMESNK